MIMLCYESSSLKKLHPTDVPRSVNKLYVFIFLTSSFKIIKKANIIWQRLGMLWQRLMVRLENEWQRLRCTQYAIYILVMNSSMVYYCEV